MPHDFHYRERDYGDSVVFEIDTDKSRYFGIPWKELGDFGRRKFENVLVLKYPRRKLVFLYGQ